jgi:hypothetical protein
MCDNEPSGIRKTLDKLSEWGKAWGWIFSLIISLTSLGVAFAVYGIQSRSDRADVKPIGMDIGNGDPSRPQWFEWKQDYQNIGRQDATRFKLILGTVDSRTGKSHVLGTPYQVAKITIGVPQHHYFGFSQTEFLDFFVTCFIYDDIREHHSEPSFYATQEPQWKSGIRPVTSEEEHQLLAGFSCAKMDK